MGSGCLLGCGHFVLAPLRRSHPGAPQRQQVAWGGHRGLASARPGLELCSITRGATQFHQPWGHPPADGDGTAGPLALFSPSSGSPQSMPGKCSSLAGQGWSGHAARDMSNPQVPPASPYLILFHNLQHGQQSREEEKWVMSRASGFHPLPPLPFPLGRGITLEPHGRSQTTLRLMCQHLPTTFQATKALRSFWMLSRGP